MIKELSVRAKPSNNKAQIFFTASLIISAILAVTYIVIPKYKSLVGLGAVAFIVAAVFIYVKYMAPKYYYETMLTSDGEPLFIVKRVTGRRATTLCRISFSEILSVKMESKEDFKNHKTSFGVVKYLYTPTLFPEKVCRISMRSAYERAEIVIECSEEFAALISDWAKEARTLSIQDDE